MRRLFKEFNQAGGDDSSLTPEEFQRGLRRKFNVEPRAGTSFLCRKYDADGNGSLSYEEFIAEMQAPDFDPSFEPAPRRVAPPRCPRCRRAARGGEASRRALRGSAAHAEAHARDEGAHR